MQQKTAWYLGYREKTAAPRWARELRRLLRPEGLFSTELPEWAQRMGRASEKGLIADVRNRQLRRVGEGSFGATSAALHPSSSRPVALKRFHLGEPDLSGAPPLRESVVPRYVGADQASMDDYDKLLSSVSDSNVEALFNPTRAAAIEARNLRQVGRAADELPEIAKNIQVPRLIDEGVSSSGHPLVWMTGLDVGPGAARAEGAARASKGLEALKSKGLGYPDVHTENVFFRDSRGAPLKRPAILDWGDLSRNVEGTPYYHDVVRRSRPHMTPEDSPFDSTLLDALEAGSLKAAPLEQRRVLNALEDV